MAALLELAFGIAAHELDLYSDVLNVSKTCSPAQLRKAYYKQALRFHPDKNNSKEAKLKFQAISWVYNFLKDPSHREEYDQDGIIPHDNECDDDDMDETAQNSWKDYFDTIFGKVSTDDIDSFALKYKMSEEEEKDVLENYTKWKGNFVKMLEYVMLSDGRDVPRWMEDYIQPAIAAGKVQNYQKAIQKSMASIEKKLAKEKNAVKKLDCDSEETETEVSDNNEFNPDDNPAPSKRKEARNLQVKKAKPKKAKPTKTKKSSDQDLVAMIRNKNGRANPLASIAARYGVSNVDDDPLDDASFAKLQSKMKRKK